MQKNSLILNYYITPDQMVFYLDRIQGRYPQKFIRETLKDILEKMTVINNLLVKRKPDPQGFIGLDLRRSEKTTRAFSTISWFTTNSIRSG